MPVKTLLLQFRHRLVFLAQLPLNILHQCHGIARFAIEAHGHAIGTDEVLEEIMLHGLLGQLFPKSLINGIVPQRTDAKDGKVDIGIVFLEKGLYLGIGREFLMEIGNGKGQDGKSSMHWKLRLQRGKLREIDIGFASFAGRVDNQSNHARILLQRLHGARRVSDGQTIDRLARQ
jgi:hypothetical protein